MSGADPNLLEAGLSALDDVFYVFRADGEPVVWNDRAAEVTGYDREEIDGSAPTDFVAADHRGRVAESIQETLETGSSTVEADLLTKDGERIPYEFRGRRLTDSSGTVVGLAGIGRDVSERNARERKLEEQASRLALFTIAFPDLAFVVDRDGRFLDFVAGEHSESLLYHDPDAFLGRRAQDVFPPEIADELVSTTRTAIETDEPQRMEYALDLRGVSGGSRPASNRSPSPWRGPGRRCGSPGTSRHGRNRNGSCPGRTNASRSSPTSSVTTSGTH